MIGNRKIISSSSCILTSELLTPSKRGEITCLFYSAKVLHWLAQIWPDWPGFSPAAMSHIEQAPAQTRLAWPPLGSYGSDCNILGLICIDMTIALIWAFRGQWRSGWGSHAFHMRSSRYLRYSTRTKVYSDGICITLVKTHCTSTHPLHLNTMQ
jgi:hypothetical protein